MCADARGSRSECVLCKLPPRAANHHHRIWGWWVVAHFHYNVIDLLMITCFIKLHCFIPDPNVTLYVLFFRHGSYLALQHLSSGEHPELWYGAGVVCVWLARLQQCGIGLWWRQHHYQGTKNNSKVTPCCFLSVMWHIGWTWNLGLVIGKFSPCNKRAIMLLQGQGCQQGVGRG